MQKTMFFDILTVIRKRINATQFVIDLNALHFIRKANIKDGETVLTNGAGGSIGTFGVQIAKTMGAEVPQLTVPLRKTCCIVLVRIIFWTILKQTFR